MGRFTEVLLLPSKGVCPLFTMSGFLNFSSYGELDTECLCGVNAAGERVYGRLKCIATLVSLRCRLVADAQAVEVYSLRFPYLCSM
jgi:hypothetical protein